MNIAGHQKTSFIDYPDKICSVIFTAGCNFRCSYCHNGHIVNKNGDNLNVKDIFNFLEKRKKFLDGVCISGGEPTLHNDLYHLIYKIKEEGFLVKLDTNGTNPKVLEKLLKENMLDYIAMDIKAPLNKYDLVTSSIVDKESLIESINLIKNSNIDYEFRTTVCKELITEDDILEISQLIKGSKRYYIQNFKDTETILGGKGILTPYQESDLLEIINEIAHKFKICKLRK